MIFSRLILIVFIFCLFCASSFAQVEQTVLMRGKHFKPIFVKTALPDLISSTAFEGKYFKMVKGKDSAPISFGDLDSRLVLRAATAYYHLNLARSYWINTMHSEYVKNLPQMTIRLEINNKFSDLGHYYADNLEPRYNDALSIPAWKQMDGIDIEEKDRWGVEIWFSPVKKILTSDLPNSGLTATGNPLTPYVEGLSEPIKALTTSKIVQATLQKLFSPATLSADYQTTILKQMGTLALTAAILEANKHADRLFLEKYYYLDTAMIPEIIYHEYSHVAQSDALSLSLSTPILEGMADYFATSISNNPHIANKIKKYSLSMPKNGKNKTLYNSYLEMNEMANSDFVLSVLWAVKQKLPEVADQLVYGARNFMNTSTSDIRHGLTSALLSSCDQVCLDPRFDRLRLLEVFEQKGF